MQFLIGHPQRVIDTQNIDKARKVADKGVVRRSEIMWTSYLNGPKVYWASERSGMTFGAVDWRMAKAISSIVALSWQT